MDSRKSTPRELGYRMPAEWEAHRATWLAWPHNPETWPDPFQLALVKEIWVQMARALSPAEQVCLLVNRERAEAEVTGGLRSAGANMERVSIHRIPTVDVWIRDYGPTFLTRRKTEPLAFVDWIFNAWGRKYPDYVRDDGVNRTLAKLIGAAVFEPGVVLEGGSIDVNGLGTCLTTEQCLLNPNRNPHLSRSQIEHVLENFLNVRQFIWLGRGIEGDDTDGHVDDVARFVNATTIVCCLEDDATDENYAALWENFERLEAATDQNGKRIAVVPLPMPGRVVVEGSRMPASYANFYIANGLVLVPTYGHPNDDRALGILAELFPDRKIVGIPCTALVPGFGAIHCVTQQEPLPP
ncbi:MAG: agmatine deiminase family protein [Deltaproteobacteria bacterium]|nr:agmatine deiminase family protein [Deltaproteobacteria bacterium]